MSELSILLQRKFWKAALLSFVFTTLLFLSTTGYIWLLKTSLNNLEQSEFVKLNIKEPQEILQHTKEIIATTPVINRIYLEWTIETISYYTILVVLFTFIYSNVFSLLLNNKLLRKKELKKFAKYSLILLGIVFLIEGVIILITKTQFVAFFFLISLPIFYLVGLAISAATTRCANLIESTIVGIKSLRFLATRFFASLFILIILAGVMINLIIATKLFSLAIIIQIFATIWNTWLIDAALRSLKWTEKGK